MQSITSQSFTASLPFILRWEGGFVDDPDDRGGRTNKGVTQNVYHAWRADQGLPQQDVQQINDQEVAAIYYQRYWLPPMRRAPPQARSRRVRHGGQYGPEPGDQSPPASRRLRRRGCVRPHAKRRLGQL